MGLPDSECVALLQWAAPRLGLRWEGFRRVRGQVCKRIARRMAERGIEDGAAYRALLERDDAEWIALDATCRVTISRFYRDRAVWDALRTTLLPPLAKQAATKGRPLRCWSAGACSGEEPYTAALLMLELEDVVPGLRSEVIATEVDGGLLERARRACYPPGTLAELPPEWRERGLKSDGGDWCMRPEVAGRVQFRQQDLRGEQPEGPFDLILCRNVAFTYFAPELQLRVLEALTERLSKGGYLAIGAHEHFPGSAEFTQVRALPIYQRR